MRRRNHKCPKPLVEFYVTALCSKMLRKLPRTTGAIALIELA
ncbi:hypothetical protein [Calothrix anomala]